MKCLRCRRPLYRKVEFRFDRFREEIKQPNKNKQRAYR